MLAWCGNGIETKYSDSVNSIKYILSVLLLLNILSLGGLVKAGPEEYPNILLITADDLGWDSLGCMGNELTGLTPNLDRLAAEGLLLTHGFVATPICGPSRQALYTGRHPQSNGMLGHGAQPPKWWKTTRNNADTQSITTELWKKGYLTGMIGKHGSQWCQFSQPPHGDNDQTGMGRNPEKFSRFTLDFLTQAKEKNKPFFLSINTHDPHRYWARHPSESIDWIRKMMGGASWKALDNGKPYPDPQTKFAPAKCPVPAPYPKEEKIREVLATYYDSVNRMDQIIGEVLTVLEKCGNKENTVVIFLSDHGMAWDLSKWSLYPSGVRTPIIIRWPSRIKRGQTDSKSVISVVDIAPTIAEICGLQEYVRTDGESFAGRLTGKKQAWNRSWAFSCFNYMNNDPKIDETIQAYSKNLFQKFDQYRPSRSLNNRNFCYVWNGWADGATELPPSMLGEFHFLLPDLGKNPSDLEYGNYLTKHNFITVRAREELYNVKTDPGCHHNLALVAKYQGKLEEVRNQMKNTLRKTGDHELASYLSFLDVK